MFVLQTPSGCGGHRNNSQRSGQKGKENLQLYSWGTHTAKHYFCKTCGIYLYHQRRANPAQCGINLGCIEGVKTWEHEPVRWTDGISHPSDRT